MNYLAKQLREAWQFFLVPGLAALLPWRWAWRWLYWHARRSGGPFDEAALAALAVAPAHLPIGDEQTFLSKVRLLWLLDYCDLYLSITRWRRGWRPWHVERVGEWPQGPFIAAGFHHGTCHWVFKTLAEARHDSMVISIRWTRDEYAGYPMRYWYGRLRYWDMARLGRLPIAYRPGIKKLLEKTLADGAAVVGLIDLPPRLAPRGQQPVRLLDQSVSLPDGIVALARDAGVPIVPYWMEFDAPMYRRRFCIGTPIDPGNSALAMQKLADILDQQIRAAPQAWFFWPELPKWIADAELARQAQSGERSSAD